MRVLTTILLTFTSLIIFSQTVTLGTGTAVNGTTEPSPVNIWYRRTISQIIYTQAELSAAGMIAGRPITELGFYVQAVPLYNIPDYEIGIKHTSEVDVSGDLDGGYSVVKSAFNYAPTAGGYDMLVLDQAFSWDGISSIVVQVCSGQVVPNYSATGQSRRYPFTNGHKYTWTDNAGNSCGETPVNSLNTKPIIRFEQIENVWTGAISTDWSNSGNWLVGIPDQNTDIRIPSGVPNFPVTGGGTVRDLSIEAGSSVTIAGGGDLTISGDLTNQGDLSGGSGRLIMNGGSNTVINSTSPILLDRMEIDHSGNVSIASGSIEILTELDIVRGTLNTNDAMTIRSTASGTGRIAALSHQCTYTIDMADSWGDDWNGGFLTVAENGTDIGTFSAQGFGSSGTFTVDDGSNYTLIYTSGAWENENTYTLSDPLLAPLFSDGTNPSTGLVYSNTASCAFNNPISGEITMERYIDPGATHWRFFSSAVQGATIAEYQGDFITSGYNGSDFPDFPFTSIYYYDESAGSGLGYEPVTTSAMIMGTGQGFQVWSGDTITGTSGFTVDLDGPPNAGAINMPVTFTNNGDTAEDGWNYIGNPYPSTINWESSAWTKTNVGNAVYVLDPDSQNMTSYVNGASSNGGSPLIASQQGFWIFTTGAAPVLTARENVKSDVDAAFWKSGQYSPGMHITLATNGISDQVVLREIEGTTDGYDQEFDAYKVSGSNANSGQLTIMNEDQSRFAIQSREFTNNDQVIPLHTAIYASSTYSISFENVEELDFSCLKLHDKITNQWYNVYEGASYDFDLLDTLNDVRFELVVGAEITVETLSSDCSNSDDGGFVFHTTDSDYQVFVYADSDLLSSYSGNGDLEVDGLFPGNYTIEFTGLNGVCSEFSNEIYILSPSQINALVDVDQSQEETWINLSISGGVAPYSVIWSEGQIGTALSVHSEGYYQYLVTDANGCEFEDSVFVDYILGSESLTLEDKLFYNMDLNQVSYEISNFDNGILQVYAIDGKLVFSSELKSNQGVIELSGFNGGVYQLIISNQEKTIEQRIVKVN